MQTIHLRKINEVHMKIEANPSMVMELADSFTFYAQNYRFHPKYKKGLWDGKITLVNRFTGVLCCGLVDRVRRWCNERNIRLTIDQELLNNRDLVDYGDVEKFIKTVGLPNHIEPRDYQIESLVNCINSERRLLLSPTSSGKSLVIYLLHRYFNKKTILVVPTSGLVLQMKSDFESYGYRGIIHTSIDKIPDGDVKCDVLVTTWQTLAMGKIKRTSNWYSQFDVVVVDECHQAKAISLSKIMENMKTIRYRFGTTGTLDGNILNQYTIEGLFGSVYESISTKSLMDKGFITSLKIRCLELQYPNAIREMFENSTYAQEIAFIKEYKPRNRLIYNIVKSLKGNKIVFFNHKEHGKQLLNMFKDDKIEVFYVDGDTSAEERDRIRAKIETLDESIFIASGGTTATGVNITRLNHMIFAHPTKSRIKTLQSIGRLLRKNKNKNKVYLYDIVDNFSLKTANYSFKHFKERLKMYRQQNFDFDVRKIEMK